MRRADVLILNGANLWQAAFDAAYEKDNRPTYLEWHNEYANACAAFDLLRLVRGWDDELERLTFRNELETISGHWTHAEPEDIARAVILARCKQ